MTDLAIPDKAGAALAIPSATVDLQEWAQRMGSAAEIAARFAATPFVPASLRVYTRRPDPRAGDPGELDIPGTTAVVTAAMLTGTEIGMPPMAALRSIDVIDGTPAIRALALRALVLRAGHQMWVVESTSTRGIVAGVRTGTGREQRSVWTIERARAAGVAGRPNWQRHPSAMLIARATGEAARWIAPEVILGLPYSVEELGDGDELEGQAETVAEPAPAGRRTAQRRTRRAITAPMPPPAVQTVSAPPPPAAAAPDDPPFDDDPPPVAVAPDTEDDDPGEPQGITTAQTRKMHALFRELDIADRGDRLAAVRNFIDREIESSTELTRDEASTVIDALQLAIEAERGEEQ